MNKFNLTGWIPIVNAIEMLNTTRYKIKSSSQKMQLAPNHSTSSILKVDYKN